MHDSVYDLAGDDPRIAKFLRTALTQFIDSPDPLLREMAQGVLDGTVDLRQAATSDVYSASFTVASQSFWTCYDNLGEAERQELARTGEQQLDTLLDTPERPPTA